MARGISSEMIAALGSTVIRPAFFVELETATGIVNVWSGIQDRVWDGKTWIGAGDLGRITDIPETTAINAVGIALTLTGIPSSYVSLALDEAVPGKNADVWFAMLDVNGDIIDDGGSPPEEAVFLAYSGRTDSVQIDEAGDKATITIQVESELIDLQRVRARRYTDEDQKSEFPDDEGFAFINDIQNENTPWGQATNRFG